MQDVDNVSQSIFEFAEQLFQLCVLTPLRNEAIDFDFSLQLDGLVFKILFQKVKSKFLYCQ